MSKLLNRQFIPAGKTIIEEGDVAQKAYFIETGQVEVYRIDPEGHDVRLNLINEGEIVGELAFFNHTQTRTANVRTVKDSTLISLTMDDIKKFMDSMDKPGRALFKLLLSRLKRANDQLISQYTSATHLNEVSRITVDNMQKSFKDTETREKFEDEVMPVFTLFIEALREFETMQDAEKGLEF